MDRFHAVRYGYRGWHDIYDVQTYEMAVARWAAGGLACLHTLRSVISAFDCAHVRVRASSTAHSNVVTVFERSLIIHAPSFDAS